MHISWQVGNVLQCVHSVLGMKISNLQTDAHLDMCLLIITEVWGKKFTEYVEGILHFLPLVPTDVQAANQVLRR